MFKRAVQKDGSQPPKSSQSYSYVPPAKIQQAAISSKFGVIAPSSSPSRAKSTLNSSHTTTLNEKASRFAPSTEDDPPPSSQPPKKRPADNQATGLSLKKALCTDRTAGFSGSSQVMDTVYYEEADFDLSDDDEFSLPSLPKVIDTPKAAATISTTEISAPKPTGSAAILDKAYSTAPVMKRVMKQVTNTETTTTTSTSASNTSTSISTSTSTANTANTSNGAFSAAYNQVANSTTTPSTTRPSIFSSPRVNNSISNNDPLPSSSRPLPWSSSPPSHMEAPKTHQFLRPTAPSAPFKPPVPKRGPVQQPLKLSSTGQNGPSKARLLQPKPPTGRQLPWMKGGASQTSSVSSATSSASSKGFATSTTGGFRSMTPQKRSSPHEPNWDVSMSAVKETQRRIKESTKKAKSDAEEVSWRTPDAAKHIAPVFLSEEQQAVIKLVLEENSVFFTGSAGTGKSVLMREIISALRRKYRTEPDRVAVTASTGLAACNIGGVTIHSFAGIGLGKENADFLIKRIKKNPKAKTRWQRTSYLIIDEISMVDGELFDKLEAIARGMRNNGHPFGGIKLVVTGDFFQLPPVPDNGRVARFAFEAEKWNICIPNTIGLTHVFRQKDPEFAAMLNELRIGRPSMDTVSRFRQLSRAITYSDGLQATELFPTRNEVEKSNLAKMQNLPGQSYSFHAVDGGTITDQVARSRLLANCMAPAVLELKRGAQVLLIKNHDETLVNGSLGRIKSFMTERTYEVITEQGGDFDKIMGWDDDSKMSKKHKKLKALMNGGASADTGRAWPLVEFTLPDGTTRDLLCSPETWKIELPNGEIQASRAQVPLILAWALSIHKAQGQTLERVKVDLSKVFEKGQAYVALSRATNQAGLQVLGFDPKKVLAHEKVRAFYNSLYSAQQGLAQAAEAAHTLPPSIPSQQTPAELRKKQEEDRERRKEEERKRQKRVIDLEEEYPGINDTVVKKNRDELFGEDETYFPNDFNDDFPNDFDDDFPSDLEEELFGHGG